MLKKICKKKLILCSIVLFSLSLLYIIPTKDNVNIIEELTYVNTDINQETIYLLDSNNYLASTSINITSTKTEDKIKELLEALIIDSNMQDNIPNGFKALIPTNTEILSINIYEDNLAKINFNEELMNTDINNEEKIIEAICYTLTSLDNIDKIMIFINGNVLTTLPQSKITLPSTLDRSFGINKEYNITDTKNINKTTIYYISKFNDQEYYVPVTKINNDNRNKIEVIIDELSSNNVYKTNLMSYLNNNTEVLSINELDNELIVNFNSAIYNDINTKEILEEVIYTISMSIIDNYDVDNIVFNVESEEIYKFVSKTIE